MFTVTSLFLSRYLKKLLHTGVNEVMGSYVVGQVANSLFQKQARKCMTNPLVTLFSKPASTTQLIFTPVPENKVSCRKRDPVDDESDAATAAKQQKPVHRKKQLTVAERKLAQREDALTAADKKGEGNQRRKQNKKVVRGELPVAVTMTKGKVVESGTMKSTAIPELETIKNRRTLFVGNVPSDYSKQMIKALFKEFGPIESVRFRSVACAEPKISKRLATIQKKIHPKRNSVNAYIVFEQDSDAVRALTKNGYEIQTGFHIRVDLASKSKIHDHRRSIFLGNLSYDISEDEVREHFSECGAIESVRIVRDHESGMGKGFGYVLFQNTDAVTLALKLNNSELKGRKLRVNHSLKKDTASKVQRSAGVTASKAQAVRNPPLANMFAGIMTKPVEGDKTKKKMKKKKMKKKKVQRCKLNQQRGSKAKSK
ncbi:RNA-binding protein 34 isoform X2 [Chiloscyllium plagiosum]|uniref:RNA-binding protein 34 isoform X2 n=1 Tax=Chiloscyllium plagiosum TaxID=36176 RepID=UPI001CB7C897|nr:RNA-binding protein 34 isoform X2 [Chiloscyllium plagiosum]